MIERTDAADMIDQALAAEPIDPIEANDPMEPIDSTLPTEPIDRIEFLLPMLRIDRSDFQDHRDDVLIPPTLPRSRTSNGRLRISGRTRRSAPVASLRVFMKTRSIRPGGAPAR